MQFNTEQLQAIECEDKKIVCLAGAGAGKTASMIERISRIVDSGVNPQSILVLTFTRAAAFNMKHRYLSKHAGTISPEFRTFHSFCYSLVSTDSAIRKALGYASVPGVASEEMTKKIDKSAQLQSKFNVSQKKLKNRNLCTPKDLYQIEMYEKTRKRLMKAENIITFDELSEEVCNLFTNDDPSITSYKEKYKYIFVDEFQDTDPIQKDFIESCKDSHLFVVGDALQSIYSFRRADSSIIKEYAVDPKWTTIRLSKNYRSTPRVCKYANSKTGYADPSYRIALVPTREDTGKVVEKKYLEYTDIYEGVSDKMLQDLGFEILNRPEGSTAILCRTNKEVNIIVNYLKGEGIVCSTNQRNDDALALMECVVDNKYFIDYVSTSLNSDQYALYLKSMDIDKPEKPVQYLYAKFGHIPKVKYIMDTVFRIREEFLSKDPVFIKAQKIFELLDIKDVIIDTDAEDNQSLKNYIVDTINKQIESDVYCGTIHSSKGLEYTNVYVINVDDKSFPLREEDNNNLFYVACTRAKDNLKVYLHVDHL